MEQTFDDVIPDTAEIRFGIVDVREQGKSPDRRALQVQMGSRIRTTDIANETDRRKA